MDKGWEYERKRLGIDLLLIKSLLDTLDKSDDEEERRIAQECRKYMKDSIRAINDEYTDNEEERMFEDVLW